MLCSCDPSWVIACDLHSSHAYCDGDNSGYDLQLKTESVKNLGSCFLLQEHHVYPPIIAQDQLYSFELAGHSTKMEDVMY